MIHRSLAKPLLLAARPKTLPAAICPVVAGSALAWRLTGQFSWLLATCTLLSTICIQVATNYFNDAGDAAKGADTAARLGPVRATAAGLVNRRTMMMAGFFAVLTAALSSIPLLHARGWPILVIGIVSLLFSYGYTGGPWPLAYRGLGEVFVMLFFGLVAVAGTVFVHTGYLNTFAVGACLLTGFQIGSLSTALIAINNLRDISEDTQSGKRTLAVRSGKTGARIMITAWCLLPCAAGLLWLRTVPLHGSSVTENLSTADGLQFQTMTTKILYFSPSLCWYPLPVVFIGLIIVARIWCMEPSAAYNKLLALAGVHLLVWTILFATACVQG